MKEDDNSNEGINTIVQAILKPSIFNAIKPPAIKQINFPIANINRFGCTIIFVKSNIRSIKQVEQIRRRGATPIDQSIILPVNFK